MLMILIAHILIAISGVVVATYSFINPKSKVLAASITLGSLTLFSGLFLVFTTNASLVKSCVTGLIYFSLVIYLTHQGYKKLQSA